MTIDCNDIRHEQPLAKGPRSPRGPFVRPWTWRRPSAEYALEQIFGGRQIAIDVDAVEPLRRQYGLSLVAEHQAGSTLQLRCEQKRHHAFGVGVGGLRECSDDRFDDLVGDAAVTQHVAPDVGPDKKRS